MIIKVVLVVGLLVLAGFILRGRMTAQRLAVRRLLGVLVLGLGLVAILFPAAVTWLANRVGVGRGTDLLLYVLVIAFLFVSVALYQRLSDLEARYVTLARRLAIAEAESAKQEPTWPTPPLLETELLEPELLERKR